MQQHDEIIKRGAAVQHDKNVLPICCCINWHISVILE